MSSHRSVQARVLEKTLQVLDPEKFVMDDNAVVMDNNEKTDVGTVHDKKDTSAISHLTDGARA